MTTPFRDDDVQPSSLSARASEAPSAVVNSLQSLRIASRIRRSYASSTWFRQLRVVQGELHAQFVPPHPGAGALTVKGQGHLRGAGQVERQVIRSLRADAGPRPGTC